MLPKIPYVMHKNERVFIPFGNFNRSCIFKDGDIFDSRGISARKYPYLTTKRGNWELEEYADRNTHALTVFDDQLVTAQGDGVYIAEKKVLNSNNSNSAIFAPINNKLVVYPDKQYVEKVGEDYIGKSLEASISAENANFTARSIQINAYRWNPQSNLLFFAETSSLYKLPFQLPQGSDTFYLGNGTVIQTTQLLTSDTPFFYCYEEGNNIYIKTQEWNDKWMGNRVVIYDYNTEKIVYGTVTGKRAGSDFAIIVSSEQQISNSTYGIFFEEQENPFCDYTRYVRVGEVILLKNTYDDASPDYGKVVEISKGALKFSGNVSKEAFMLLHGSGVYTSGVSSFSFAPGDEIRVEASENNGYTLTVSEIDRAQVVLIGQDNEKIVDEFIPSSSFLVTKGSNNRFTEFKVGDCVTVSGCSIEENNISFVISKMTNSTVFASADIFTAGSSTTEITIARSTPDLDFICEKDNRLYGVSNKDKTIYVSALGDPTNMFAYEGVSTDSFAVAVGGEGDFTACCKYGDSVLFFKENKLYKLTGSYPAEFALYSYDVAGVREGSEKSCVVINEALYYCGRDGIYVYTGGVPTLISNNFGEFRGSSAVGCTDGESYYVSLWDAVADDETYLFAYNTRLGIWTLEDKDTFYMDSVTLHGRPIFLAEGGNIYEINRDIHATPEWKVQFVPFYETIDGKKSYSRIVMRVSIPKESYMQIRLRFDGGYWLNMGTVVGKTDNIIPVRIPINRCDKFELELSGKGECTILDIMREYHVSEE
jgi:hypothetical protein